jgi:hypothetical protein
MYLKGIGLFRLRIGIIEELLWMRHWTSRFQMTRSEWVNISWSYLDPRFMGVKFQILTRTIYSAYSSFFKNMQVYAWNSSPERQDCLESWNIIEVRKILRRNLKNCLDETGSFNSFIKKILVKNKWKVYFWKIEKCLFLIIKSDKAKGINKEKLEIFKVELKLKN